MTPKEYEKTIPKNTENIEQLGVSTTSVEVDGFILTDGIKDRYLVLRKGNLFIVHWEFNIFEPTLNPQV